MKKLTGIFLCATCALSLASCNKWEEADPVFIASSGYELRIGQRVVLSCDPLTWQFGFSPDTKECRVSDDQMKTYWLARCSEVPQSKGQKVNATITYTAGGEVKTAKGKFEVAKVEGEKVWLWCGEKNNLIGVTVRIIRQ